MLNTLFPHKAKNFTRKIILTSTNCNIIHTTIHITPFLISTTTTILGTANIFIDLAQPQSTVYRSLSNPISLQMFPHIHQCYQLNIHKLKSRSSAIHKLIIRVTKSPLKNTKKFLR